MNARIKIGFSVLCLLSCGFLSAQKAQPAPATFKPGKTAVLAVSLQAPALAVEVSKKIPLSARATLTAGLVPVFSWTASAGSVAPTGVDGEVDYTAPAAAGTATVTVTVSDGRTSVSKNLEITILAAGSLKRTAAISVMVDASRLRGVFVDETHKSENFTGPLKIKGEFRADPETLEAFAGGSWPTYDMYDDGTHGDRIKGDGIWSITFDFEKSDGKVHFAFDDASAYRKQWESGVGFALKQAWQRIAGPDRFDSSDLYFIPMKDQVLEFGAAQAADPKAKLYQK